MNGKVVRVGDIWTVVAKKLKLEETTFADSTGIVVVDIWEQHIPMIENGKLYRITPVQVRSLAGKRKLSTMVCSVVTEIADETLSKVFVAEEDLKTVDWNEVTVKVSNIYSVQTVEVFIHCLNKYCSWRVLQLLAGKIVHCDRCGYTMRASNCTKQVSVKILIQLDSCEEINLRWLTIGFLLRKNWFRNRAMAHALKNICVPHTQHQPPLILALLEF